MPAPTTPYTCPSCGEPVPRRRRRALSAPLLGTRRTSTCDGCGTSIVWARRPWNLFCAGQWTFVAGALLGAWVLFPALVDQGPVTHPLRWLMLVTLLAGAALMLWSLRTLRIEPA